MAFQRVNRRRAAAVAGAVMLAAVLAAQRAAAAPGDEARITDPAITQSAGLAADASRNVYWTANTSTTPGVVYAISPTGASVGVVNYDADTIDVEALSMQQGVLYVADIGDVVASRGSVQVYVLDALTYGASAQVARWDLSYPDGPHDAHAMAISPRGNLYVVTFGAPGFIYRVVGPPANDAQLTLERVSQAPDWVTDATFLDDGTLAVRTFNSVQLLDSSSDAFTVFASAPVAGQAAGESLTQTLGAAGLTLGSKGAGSKLLEVALPQTMASLPPANSVPPQPSATPTPEPTATSAPSQKPVSSSTPAVGDGFGSSQPVNSVTTMLAAFIAAVCAGLFAFIAYRRSTPR